MITNEEILEAVGDMTVNEFVEFIEAFKAKFGVEVAAPTPTTTTTPMTTDSNPIEPDAFSVVLVEPGPKKIEAIKVMREITGLGLKEAKAATETPEYVVKADLTREGAEALRDKFAEIGSVVVIR